MADQPVTVDSDFMNETSDSASRKRVALFSLLGIAFLNSLTSWVFAQGGLGYSLSFILLVIAQLVATIYWCKADAEQRNFEFTIGQGVLIFLFAIIGLPNYLLKSRGFGKGLIAIIYALLFWALMFIVSIVTLLALSLVEDRRGIFPH